MNGGFMQPSGGQRFGITMAPSADGVTVTGVTVGSPAAQAGIRPGDQIVAVNGQNVTNPNDMIQLVSSASADQALDVQLLRNGQTVQSQVTLAGNFNNQGSIRQAGYAQGMDGHFSGQASGDIHARLNQLERMVQDLSNQIQQMTQGNSNDNSRNDQPRPTESSDRSDNK
jgi:predicted metalloprotease with PDZ domain